MLTCSKITLHYKRKQITESQHHWIIFVKNQIEKETHNIISPLTSITSDGVFQLKWLFSYSPIKIAIINFFPSGFWKTFFYNEPMYFGDKFPTKFLSYQFLDFLKKYATKN